MHAQGTAIIVLTRELCTVGATTVSSRGGDEVFRPGRLICPAAEEAARNSFERVIRMESAPKPEDAGGHLVLIPRFADMEATAPLIRKRNMSLLLEWSAIDPSGKILWAQTVEGKAQRGGAAGPHQKIVEMVMRDLIAKSTDAIEESQEIRQFFEKTLPEK